MYNFQQRANAVFAFFVSVAFAMVLLTAASGPLLLHFSQDIKRTPPPAIDAAGVNVRVGRVGFQYDYNNPSTQLGWVWFNLDADLRPWFHWNTKQLHVYAVVAFETPQHHSNEIVIWDHIVTSVDQARLQLSKQKAEYLVSDIAHKLSGLNGTLRLEWNVVPWVGFLQMERGPATEIAFPQPSPPSHSHTAA
ncbi:hypothetical protein CXG81DRAFT_25604 [Caulochytrium protostelioides]|uniref:Signal peptidase subunit 3 n=2 Tax=Caulochytrium protostelioides TaxID=1555241 RepID=A0A4P9X9E4_9FUNG|nr:hypothetical protein CXG81DRAFT_25604 [Caulochytrium protostelioides]|eukprot:RKP01700.1 hypothetical protein CXG81DRAFT_25604 [Caulochytrium protostelioides]